MRGRPGWVVGVTVGLALLAAPAAHAAAILRAHVQFTGKVPRLGPLKRTDPACGGNKFAMEEDVLVGATGGLKNVLVYVSKGGAAAAGGRTRDAELATQACMVRPRVAAVTQGAVLQYHWLQPGQMIDGLALGETTPGPLIMVVAFVGFVGGWTHQVLGPDAIFAGAALAASVATFFTFVKTSTSEGLVPMRSPNVFSWSCSSS